MPAKAPINSTETSTAASESLAGTGRFHMRGSGRDAQGTDALYSARRWPRT